MADCTYNASLNVEELKELQELIGRGALSMRKHRREALSVLRTMIREATDDGFSSMEYYRDDKKEAMELIEDAALYAWYGMTDETRAEIARKENG